MKTHIDRNDFGKMPPILGHSKAKLRVVKGYLELYFKTAFENHRVENLNITLIDGFCGRGLFNDDENEVLGSPLVMLEAVKDAEARISQEQNRRVTINAQFIFIDKNKKCTDFLKKTLSDRDYNPNTYDIITGEYLDNYIEVCAKVKNHARNKHRSIFFLDQFGYSDVTMESLRYIFRTLTKPEVIWTFAIDGLLNYIPKSGNTSQPIEQFGMNYDLIRKWVERGANPESRAIIQHAFIANMRKKAVSHYFTPFLFKSKNDNRWMLLSHLSGHQIARDKMLNIHWSTRTCFSHCGKGSMFISTYKEEIPENSINLFNFLENDREIMLGELNELLPNVVHDLFKERNYHIPLEVIIERFANGTAAPNSDFYSVFQEMNARKEIIIMDKNHKIKSPNSKLTRSCKIILPLQRTMFFGK